MPSDPPTTAADNPQTPTSAKSSRVERTRTDGRDGRAPGLAATGAPTTAACDCNRAMMAALSPMHPFHYIELACDEHRREFQQASLADSIRDYEPHNLWRTP